VQGVLVRGIDRRGTVITDSPQFKTGNLGDLRSGEFALCFASDLAHALKSAQRQDRADYPPRAHNACRNDSSSQHFVSSVS